MTNNAVNNQLLEDFSIEEGASGASRVLRIENNNDTVSSEAAIETQVGGTSADDTYFRYLISTTNSWAHGIDQTDTQSFDIAYNAGATATPSSTKAIKSTTSGELLYPSQPLFKAYLSGTASDVTGDGTIYTIAFDSETIDQSSNFNTGTYRFTAPKTGKYLFSYGLRIIDIGGSHTSCVWYLYKNATEKLCTYNINASQKRNTSNEAGVNGLVIVNLAANDYVDVRGYISGSTKTIDILHSYAWSYFGGCLLG